MFVVSIDVTYASYNFGQVGFFNLFLYKYILLELQWWYHTILGQYNFFLSLKIGEYVELNLIVGLPFFIFWHSQSLCFVRNMICQPFVIPQPSFGNKKLLALTICTKEDKNMLFKLTVI